MSDLVVIETHYTLETYKDQEWQLVDTFFDISELSKASTEAKRLDPKGYFRLRRIERLATDC